MNFFLSFLKKNIVKIAVVSGAFIAVILAINIFSHSGRDKRVFMYPVSGSSKIHKEVRYLDSHPIQGKIWYYVDELILGPSFYRGRPLFTLGTRVENCFLRGHKLYVELSETAGLQEDNSLVIEEGVRLFKKNIKKNFSEIKDVEIFIDGNFIESN